MEEQQAEANLTLCWWRRYDGWRTQTIVPLFYAGLAASFKSLKTGHDCYTLRWFRAPIGMRIVLGGCFHQGPSFN